MILLCAWPLKRWWWRFMLWIWRVRTSHLQSAFEHTWIRRSQNSNSSLPRFSFPSQFLCSNLLSFIIVMTLTHSLWELNVSNFRPVVVNHVFLPQATGLSSDNMRVVLERCYNDLRLLYVPNKTLKAEGFFRSNKVPIYFFSRSETHILAVEFDLWPLLHFFPLRFL